MAEYIERNALIAEFKRLTLGENSLVERLFADGVYAVIETFPAADVSQVRHGSWERNSPDDIVVYCSQCMMPQDAPSNYCPSCGARMDKEAEHEAD